MKVKYSTVKLAASDLRLGNLIVDEEGQLGTVCRAEDQEVANFDTGYDLGNTCNVIMRIGNDIYTPDNVFPLILNEEWLKEFNLKNDGSIYEFEGNGNKYSVRISKTGGRLYLGSMNAIPVYHVHEFQNWYKLLTGQELQSV